MYYSSVKNTSLSAHDEQIKVAVASNPKGPFKYVKTLLEPFSTVKVDADDIEGDERFSVVQFKFREIILSELGEIGNIGFHRVFLRIIFCLFGSGAVASGEIGVEDIDREVIRKSTITKKLLRKDTE